MKCASVNVYANARDEGAAAKALLRPGTRGQVLAALDSVAYLMTSAQELLWVASSTAPMHRRCLRLSSALPRLDAGVLFCVNGSRLGIDSGLVVNRASASLWLPAQVNCEEVVDIEELPGRAQALAVSLDGLQAHGFGHYIPDLVRLNPPFAVGTGDPVITQGQPLVQNLIGAWRSQDRQRIALAVDALVGFGTGLTPCGDDFLGGLLFGVRTLRAAYPDLDLPELPVFGERHRCWTNPISFTLLDDLAKGHATEPLHHIANGILSGEPLDNLRPVLLQLTSIGHSTGWDTLSGLLAGLLLAETREGVSTCANGPQR
jgi:hypothetical protein